MGVHWKIWFLRRVHEKPIYRGQLHKKGAWTVCRFMGGGGGEGGGRVGKKEGGDVFEGGVILQCALCMHK